MHFYEMEKLHFPDYKFRFKIKENKNCVFDSIRKKWVVITPEEWVRQHCAHFLINEKQYPSSLIAIEKKISVFQTVKRFDLVVYYPDGQVAVLIECKAPKVKISQKVFDQLARYNLKLNSDYMMVTNGLSHYYCKMDKKLQQYKFMEHLPDYLMLKK